VVGVDVSSPQAATVEAATRAALTSGNRRAAGNRRIMAQPSETAAKRCGEDGGCAARHALRVAVTRRVPRSGATYLAAPVLSIKS
jgi:hypothetical protein